MQARFFNETYEEHYRGHFILTIDDKTVIVDPWVPPDPIEYRVWEKAQYEIRESMQPDPYDPVQPVPYIAHLSQTGAMTIGWDRMMAPPSDYKVIPEAQIAVKSWDDVLEE